MAIAERLALAALLAATVSGCGQDGEEQAPETAPAAVEPAPAAVDAPADGPGIEVAQHEPPGNRPGEMLWQLYCVECHAPGGGHPGTMMLQEKKGQAQAVILGREDLTEQYIAVTVRGGLLEMTPFRPTEITDEELAALARYVRTTAPADAPATSGTEAGG